MKSSYLETAPERVISRPSPTPVTEAAERKIASTRPEPPKGSLAGSLMRWLVLIAMGVVAWYYSPQWWPWVQARLHPADAAASRPAPRPTPVITAPVVAEPVNVYLDGLGTVTAFNTVTVKSRVEGELTNVAFTEGQMVKQGDLLAEIDPRPYQMQRDQAKGKMTQDEAALILAQATLDRQNELMKSNATTPQLIDQQVAVVNQARALMQIDKAIYENALLQLEYCRITAPISGRLGLRIVDRGNIVRANDPNGLMIITQLEPISLVFTIPQDQIPRIQQRMKETNELTVYAYDRDFKIRLATGKLVAIDNQVDSTTGTLKLKAMFDNKDHSLFPNQFVNARLLLNTVENALVVPSVAVQRGPDSRYVYVVRSDETVELRNVTVGAVDGNRSVIESGLAVGEVVVTDGLDKLQPDSKVTLKSKPGTGPSAPGGSPAAHGKGKPTGTPPAGQSTTTPKKAT